MTNSSLCLQNYPQRHVRGHVIDSVFNYRMILYLKSGAYRDIFTLES